jgi:hypothetical protein
MAGIEKGVGFPITATDQFSSAFDKLKGKVTEAQGGFERLKGLATLAVAGVSVAGFAALVKNAIDAADEMGKLSQKTGIAVGELSKLKYAADLSGVGTEALGKGIKTLSAQMVEAGDKTSKANQIFRAMGVDLKGGPMAVITQLADVFQGLEDGELKTTLATQLFGKAAMDLIPMLNQGKAGLKQVMEEARRLGLVLDEETTRAAEKFNDNLRAIEASSKAAGISIFNEMADPLVRITNAMKEAAIEGGILQAVIVGIGGALAELYGLSESKGLKPLLKDLREYKEEREDLQARLKAGDVAFEAAAKQRLDFLDREITKLEKIYKLRTQPAPGDAPDNWDARFGGTKPLVSPNSAAIAAALATGGKGPTDFERALAAATKDLAVAQAELANGTDTLTTSEKKLLEVMKDVTWAKFTKGERDQIQALYEKGIAAEKTGRSIAFLRAEEEKNNAARQQQGEILSDLEERWRDEAENLEHEAALIGLSNAAREKAILLLKKEEDLRVAAGLKGLDDSARATAIKSIEESYARMLATIDNREFKENQLTFWNQLGDLAGGFASALTNGVGGAFDYLKQQAKQFLAELVAIFAKRWFLQMAASATGSSALSAVAGGVGQGSVAGAAGSFLGSSLFGSAADPAAILASGGTEGLATSGLLGSGGLMSTMGAFMATPAGWVVAGVAAIAALAYAFRDKGENWQATLGFGANANAYTNTGPFGAEGFQSIQGSDAINRQIQAFFASTGAVDAIIASTLSATTIATITQNLGGAYTQRNDGQPAQFAFGAGDDTAAQQLTLEYLQKKYGTIFDSIDKTFADFIRSYTGDSGDLLKEIDAFARLFQALSNSGVPGLDIDALRNMQQAGESLTDTFNAVAGSMSTYYQEFFSNSERHDAAMAGLTERFHDLGIEMPHTRAEFRSLVSSLDLATDSGAELWRKLIELAPAFAALIPPMEDIIDLAAAVGNPLGRGGGTANALGRGAVGAFQFGHLGTTIDAIAGANIPDFDNSPIYRRDRENAALGEAAAAALDLAKALQETKDSLGIFLRDLASNPSLSPLDPKGQLDSATASFWSDLALARAGDPAAAARIQGDLTNALTLGHTNYASGSQYVDLFSTLTAAAGSFANAPSTGTQTVALLTTTNLTLGDIHAAALQTNELLGRLMDAGHEDAETVAGAVTTATMSTQDRR